MIERETLLKQISELKEANNKEVSSYKSQISKWRLDYEELNSKLASSKHIISELENEISSLKLTISTTESVTSNISDVSKGSLLPLTTELSSLKNELSLTKNNVNEYKLLLLNSEEQLKKLIKSKEEFEVNSVYIINLQEETIKKLEEEKNKLEEKLKSQTDSLSSHESEVVFFK